MQCFEDRAKQRVLNSFGLSESFVAVRQFSLNSNGFNILRPGQNVQGNVLGIEFRWRLDGCDDLHSEAFIPFALQVYD